MILEDKFRAHALRVANWFTESMWAKYSLGQLAHGGFLPDKGGLLHEVECEVIDQAVYIQTLREQLLRVEKWVEHGESEKALIALSHILHGTPADRLPED